MLESALNESDSEKRQIKLEKLMGGYSRFSAQPRLQPTRKGGHFAPAQAGDDSLWGVRRHLESTDLRRWPPAVQALLRRLFAEVAAAGDAEPRKRTAAAIRLARLQASTGMAGGGAVSPAATWQLVLRASTSTCTCASQPLGLLQPPLLFWNCSSHPLKPSLSAAQQDSSPADLEPLLGDAQMHSCLLAAPDMPDKRAVARLLASLVRALAWPCRGRGLGPAAVRCTPMALLGVLQQPETNCRPTAVCWEVVSGVKLKASHLCVFPAPVLCPLASADDQERAGWAGWVGPLRHPRLPA